MIYRGLLWLFCLKMTGFCVTPVFFASLSAGGHFWAPAEVVSEA